MHRRLRAGRVEASSVFVHVRTRLAAFWTSLRLHVLQIGCHQRPPKSSGTPWFSFNLLRSTLRSRLAQTGDDLLPAGEQIHGNELDARVFVLEYRRAARDGDNLYPFGRAGL